MTVDGKVTYSLKDRFDFNKGVCSNGVIERSLKNADGQNRSLVLQHGRKTSEVKGSIFRISHLM